MFEFHRNKALNSNTFFGERAGLDKPPFVQNNFGGVLGGPVLRNKLFFFSSFEGYRNREGVLFRRTVPTADMKRGDFSDYRNVGTGALVPIYDPWTQCGINNPGTGAFNGDCGAPGVPNRQQFPNNIIPSNRISPIAKRYLEFPVYAEPTVAGRWRTENWEKNASVGGDNDQLSFRGDYNVSQNQRIIGRYTRFESTNLPVDLYGNGQRQGDPYSPEHFVTTQVMAADTHTFNSSTVLDVRFGFLRWDYDRVPGNIGINLTSSFGLPTVPYGQISERSGIPNMESIPTIGAGSNSFISTGLLYAVNNTYSVTPTLTKLAGAHTLKMGGNIMWATEDYFQNNSTGGTFTFANNPTALDGTNPGATGDPFASFLIGIPTGGTYQSSGWTYAATSYQAFFLDDSWQVSPKLTLNLGFRLERPGAFTERDDRIVVFDRDAVNPVLAGRTNPVTGQPFLGAFELVNSNEQPDRGLRKQVWRAVPRGGIAYQLGENTVLRGGAGTFITPSTVRFQDGVNGPVIQRTNTIVTSVDNNRTFFTDMSNPFPTGVENFPGRDESYQRVLLGGTARRFYYDEEGYPGYSHQWNLALQHQFRNNLSMEVTYSGLDGNHLPNSIADNQLGREHIDRAANDTTICSLTNNAIIPQGQPGFVAGQQDTCYGAYLRQLVTESVRRADPRRRALDADRSATAAAHADPAVWAVKSGRIFGLEPLSRVDVPGRKALRRRRHGGRPLHVLEEHDQCGDPDDVARGRGGYAGCRLSDERSRRRVVAEQLRHTASRSPQLRLRPPVRRGTPVRYRRDGDCGQADQWLDPEWRDNDSEWIAARIHRHAESDWIGLRLAAEYGSKLRQERRRGGARPA